MKKRWVPRSGALRELASNIALDSPNHLQDAVAFLASRYRRAAREDPGAPSTLRIYRDLHRAANALSRAPL